MIYEVRPEDFSPSLESAGCFVEYEKKIILLLRQDDKKVEPGKWGIPAGKIELNEKPLEAVIRETFEETNIEVPVKRMKYFREFYVRYPDFDFVFHLFNTKFRQIKRVTINPDEHKDYGWISPRKAMKIEHPMHGLREFINAFYHVG